MVREARLPGFPGAISVDDCRRRDTHVNLRLTLRANPSWAINMDRTLTAGGQDSAPFRNVTGLSFSRFVPLHVDIASPIRRDPVVWGRVGSEGPYHAFAPYSPRGGRREVDADETNRSPLPRSVYHKNVPVHQDGGAWVYVVIGEDNGDSSRHPASPIQGGDRRRDKDTPALEHRVPGPGVIFRPMRLL